MKDKYFKLWRYLLVSGILMGALWSTMMFYPDPITWFYFRTTMFLLGISAFILLPLVSYIIYKTLHINWLDS
jgi:hypothetical protein